MDKVAGLTDKERSELFQATADDLGLPPAAVEKDFWVCWALKKIFAHSALKNQLMFKGGTSLSKCFELIERFSEDIDLILDWQLLTEEDPYQERSNTPQDKFNKSINAKALEYITNTLRGDLMEAFGGIGSVEQGENGKKELIFQYPKSFDSDYIRSEILIEVGPLSAMAPSREVVVQCYAAKRYPDLFAAPDIGVRTIEARKTFWDKVTILHGEAHRPADKPLPMRYSRHYYDIYQMLNTWVKEDAMGDLELLKAVAAFKKKFYPQRWANYQAVIDGTVALTPEEHTKKILLKDYEAMQEMIHGHYPDFAEIMEPISGFEMELNKALSH